MRIEDIENDKLIRDRVLNPNKYPVKLPDGGFAFNCYSPAVENYALMLGIKEVCKDEIKALVELIVYKD